MHLDSFTLLVSSSAAMVFLGLVLLYFWHVDRASRWLLWWALPLLVSGTTVMAYMRPDWETEFATIVLGNAMRIAALSLFWHGARIFEGRRPLFFLLPVAPLAWIALCLYPPFFESLAARVVMVSICNGAFFALAARELWRDRSEALASRPAAVLLLLGVTALMLVRIAAVNVLPFPMGAQPLDPAWMGLFNFVAFAHACGLGVLFIALTKERRESEQREFAHLDPLTGLLNRRAFMLEAEHAAGPGFGSTGPVALLVLDLDRFKAINDRYGHNIGDRVLVAFAGIARRCVRASDQLYRMGGEEFCFILPGTSQPDALAVAERIRTTFAADIGNVAAATVSIGVAVADAEGADIERLLTAADTAVYEAKARGRNRVVLADPAALRPVGPALAPSSQWSVGAA